MTNFKRTSIVYDITALSLLALQFGHLDLWQRAVSIAAFVAGVVILPKPWNDAR